MKECYALRVKNTNNFPFILSKREDSLEKYARNYWTGARANGELVLKHSYEQWRDGFDVVKIIFGED